MKYLNTKAYDRINKYKNIMNNKIKNNILSKNLKIKKIKALCLDSKKLRTTKMLLKLGLDQRNIKLIEYDNNTHLHHIKNGINSLNCSFEEFVQNTQIKFKYNICVAYFCNTVKSNWVGIRTLIKRIFLKNNSLLVLTFCQRTSGGSYLQHFNNLICMIKRYLMRQNKKIIFLYENFYGNPRWEHQTPMHTSYWIIKKSFNKN